MQASLFKKFIFIFGLAILFLGGILFWLLNKSSSTTPSTPTVQHSTSDFPVAPQNNSNSNPVSAPPQPVETGYSIDSLFNILSAQKVSFTRVAADASGSMAGLYDLYKKDKNIAKSLYPSNIDFSIGVSMVDLNHDGIQEAIVYEDLPGFCGSGGCTLDIYQRNQKGWNKIFSAISGPDVGIANSSTNEYSDLFFTVHGEIKPQSTLARYIWNNNQYNSKENVAIWNGSQFTLIH